MWNPQSQTVHNQNPFWRDADSEGVANEIMENARAGKSRSNKVTSFENINFRTVVYLEGIVHRRNLVRK